MDEEYESMLNDPRTPIGTLLRTAGEVLAARQELDEPLHASFAFPVGDVTFVVTVSPATEVVYDSVFSEIQ